MHRNIYFFNKMDYIPTFIYKIDIINWNRTNIFSFMFRLLSLYILDPIWKKKKKKLRLLYFKINTVNFLKCKKFNMENYI